jgi:hypothetical protein
MLTLGLFISEFVTACPRLTELSVICPHQDDYEKMRDTRRPSGPVRAAEAAMSEIVHVCKALPDFNTLQIVHYLYVWYRVPHRGAEEAELAYLYHQAEEKKQKLRELTYTVKGVAVDGLKQNGFWGRRKMTLRVIELKRYEYEYSGLYVIEVEECDPESTAEAVRYSES